MHDIIDILYICIGIWLIIDRFYRARGLGPQDFVISCLSFIVPDLWVCN